MSLLPTPAAPNPSRPSVSGCAAAPGPRGRASWSGLLRLSLVAIPVKAYPVVASSQETHFHQLHAGCGQRIRHEKHCPVHGQVDAGALVSGYAYAPQQHLVLDEADLDRLRPARDKALSLEHFLDPAQVDPALFSGRSLYLLPDGPAARHPYLVLAQAMQQRHRWALGRVLLNSRQHPALVRPTGRVLTLHILHYPAQLWASTPLEADLRGGAAGADEGRLANMLIDATSVAVAPWADYRDDLAEKLAALVEARLQGQSLPTPAAEEAPVLRLLDALQQSVAQVLNQQPAAGPAASARGKGRNKAPRRSP